MPELFLQHLDDIRTVCFSWLVLEWPIIYLAKLPILRSQYIQQQP